MHEKKVNAETLYKTWFVPFIPRLPSSLSNHDGKSVLYDYPDFHLYTSGLLTKYFLYGQAVKHLENFSNKLNTKHPSIKFEYKERISFVDTEK